MRSRQFLYRPRSSQQQQIDPSVLRLSSNDDQDSREVTNSQTVQPIDVSQDPRLYRVRLLRATGIDWGTDLSFCFVYVRDLDPTGSAALSGQVQVGDQLCEVMPVLDNKGEKPVPIPLIGASFDAVMSSLLELDKSVKKVDLVFFRGTKAELKAICSGGDATATDTETFTVTVIENKGSAKEQIRTLKATPGTNVRQLLVDNGINVYQSITRWTNCKGKQLCGTCIVNVTEGGMQTNRKSVDEASTLRENPDSYRLSCVTFAYGDITVETFPPIQPTQWTR